jgi:hypothetical protein
LSWKTRPRANRVDDGGSARLLSVLDLGVVGVVGDRHERDRSATRHRRHGVREQLSLGDEDAGRARSTDELVGGEEDGVLAGEALVGAADGGVHLDAQVRTARGVVPEGESAVTVKDGGHGGGIGDDPRDVRRRREASDLQGSIGEAAQLVAEVVQIEPAAGVLRDDHHVGDRLAPRQLVGVVLVRSDEHDGPAALGDRWRGRAQPERLGATTSRGVVERQSGR